MLLLPLTVVQPPLPPDEIGYECDHCYDNYVKHGIVLDHEKPPCDHADVVGMAGLITGTMIAFVFSAHFVTVACAAEGTLAELGKRYSSIELQHKAMEWREA